LRVLASVWFACGVLLVLSAAPAASQATFVNVAEEAGVDFHYTHGGTGQKYFIETMGPGCAFLDYNGDGHLDIYAVNGHTLDPDVVPDQTNILYHNRGDGTFLDVAEKSGTNDGGYGVGVTAADYDNDGDADLYISNYGPNALYRNDGDGSFTDRTTHAGVGDDLWGTGSAWLDFDNDGALDLYVANYVTYSLDVAGKDLTPYMVAADEIPTQDLRAYPSPDNFAGSADVLYRNQEDGTFADVTARAGVLNPDGKGMGVVCADYDADGDVDIFVANDQSPNFLYQNAADGTFVDVALIAGVGYSGDGRMEASMGADFGDYDNDGLLDLVVPNFHHEPTSLYRNEGDGMFSYESSRSGIGGDSLPFVGWSTAFFDYDNDGWLDVFIANGHTLDNVELFDATTSYAQRNQLFANLGDGRFEERSESLGAGMALENVSRGAAFGDYDDDGDVDIFVVNSTARADLLRNEGGSGKGNWLRVQTVGTRSNRDGVGARIELRAGGLHQIREIKTGSGLYGQNDMRASFGLGQHPRIEILEVRWPSGVVDRLHDITANRTLTIKEGVGLLGEVKTPE
jgi:enediyne biosynthesis protein E4